MATLESADCEGTIGSCQLRHFTLPQLCPQPSPGWGHFFTGALERILHCRLTFTLHVRGGGKRGPNADIHQSRWVDASQGFAEGSRRLIGPHWLGLWEPQAVEDEQGK